MGFIESIRLAFSSLSSNKMRSLLTMLGIIIGISAVITITTIGNSIQKTLSNTLNQFGMNSFFAYLSTKPLSEEEEEDFDYVITDEDCISMDMLYNLMDTYPDEFKISMNEDYSSAQIINSNNAYINTNISGVTDGFLEEGKINLLQGRNISLRDNKEKKHTMLVSDIFVKQYFTDGSNPVGQTLSFTMSTGESQDFTIVGVYEYTESKLGSFTPGTKDINKVTPVFIPIETASKLQGILNPTYFSATISWNTDFDMVQVENDIRNFFDEQYEHNKYWTVELQNQQSTLDMMNQVLNIVTIAISVIAAISLIVGGVGVMNIMLVSIVERTKEIGIRKALGAKNSSIRLQFVVESIIICLIGGIIGIILGVVNGLIIGQVAEALVNSVYTQYKDIISISVSPSFTAIVIAVVFSMLTGIFFGYYPANKAAKMNPIDALRYE